MQVDANAIAHEDIASERAEEDEALHDADQARREVGSLQRVAGVLQAAEQHRDHADGERVVAGERRDHDPGVAAVGRGRRQTAWIERVAEVAVLTCASDTGDRAGKRHHGEDLPARAHAGIARGARRVSDHLHLEPEARARVEHPDETATATPISSPSGSTSCPTFVVGQFAAGGRFLPCGKTLRSRSTCRASTRANRR